MPVNPGSSLLLRGTNTKTSERFVPVVRFCVPLLEHPLVHRQGESDLLFRPWAMSGAISRPRARFNPALHPE
jgi:hypothetical protein